MMHNPPTHRHLLETCLSGQKPARLPVALWRHFPVDDQSPASLAAATLNFQHTFDFDLVKVTPSSSFCIRDWGAVDTWNGNPEGTRDFGDPVIKDPPDLRNLTKLNPKNGALAAQIECLGLLKKELGNQTPLLQTIFSPLSQMKNLVGKANLGSLLRQFPDLLHEGLRIITDSIVCFIEECKQTGIDGIFYAVQHASFDQMTEQEFIEFGKHYDLSILKMANNFWLNMAHIHGDNLMFDEIVDYPVHILNWHDRHTEPSLKIALQKFNGAVCGGLRRWETMALGTPVDIEKEVFDAVEQTGGRNFILGTGCVLPIVTPFGNIIAARQITERIRG